jgi:hypothetical protein
MKLSTVWFPIVCANGGYTAQKPKTAARHGFDQHLPLAVVTQRLAGRINTRADGGIGNGASGPNNFDQLFTADQAFGILDQMAKNIENLRHQWAHLVRDPELKLIRIQFE